MRTLATAGATRFIIVASTQSLRYAGLYASRCMSTNAKSANTKKGNDSGTATYKLSGIGSHKDDSVVFSETKTPSTKPTTPTNTPSKNATQANAAPAVTTTHFENMSTKITESDIITALTESEKLSGTKLNFPKLVSMGNQSSGKSSVMEALTGVELFPKGAFMVTKRPLSIVLQRVESGKWAEFEDGVKIFDFEEVRKRIERENQLVGKQIVSENPIHVKICSPHVYNLSVTDLPGYISVVKHGEDKNLPKKIRELCKPYVLDQNTIPLVISSATEDPANCKGLKEVISHNADGRSFGVVTKMDLPNNLDATLELLRNEMYPLGFGFFGVVLRSSDSIKNGVGIEQQFVKEDQFFTQKKLKDGELSLGVPLLRKTLSETMLKLIAPQLPKVIIELDKIIERLQRSESFLTKLSEESDLDTISKDLAAIVKRLHTESSYRTSFEKGFRLALREQVEKMVNEQFKEKFGKKFMSESFPGETNVQDPENPYEDQIGSERIHITEHMGQILNHRYSSVKEFGRDKFDLDRLKRVFIFGDNCPEKLTDKILHNLKDKFSEIGGLLSFFTLRLPDDRNVSRIEWTDNLNRAINCLIDPASKTNLQLLSFDLIMKELFEFINGIQIDNPNSQKTELAREFGKYLFDKIGRQIYGKDLASSIYHHMNTEKRPDPDFHMMGYELSRLTGKPLNFTHWFTNPKRTDIEVFGPEWTSAYSQMLVDRVTDALFKSIGVNLLDPLIEEAIRYTLQTFRGDHVAEEAEKQKTKITALKKHRDTLLYAAKTYTITSEVSEEKSGVEHNQ